MSKTGVASSDVAVICSPQPEFTSFLTVYHTETKTNPDLEYVGSFDNVGKCVQILS